MKQINCYMLICLLFSCQNSVLGKDVSLKERAKNAPAFQEKESKALMPSATLASELSQEKPPMPPLANKVSQRGMEFHWELKGERLDIFLKAPTTGWLAVGFHHLSQLEGARLFMGRVTEGKLEIEEHIAAPPDHYAVKERSFFAKQGKEENGSSSFSFSMSIDRKKSFDQQVFLPGNKVHLILAYSVEDDFFHHSTMRTSIEITL